MEPIEDYTCKTNVSIMLKLNTTTTNAHRAIIQFRKESKDEFYTYQLKENKSV